MPRSASRATGWLGRGRSWGRTRPPRTSTAARPLCSTSSSPRPAGPAPGASGAPAGPHPPGVGGGWPAAGAGLAVAEAGRQVGKPYEWAGAGPDSFDCSGLTMWAWRAAGVQLSHSAEYQFSETHRVELTDLRPGDLVFFGDPIHHVGIYVGGATMIEAPHTGEVVR